jgi:hypothetical protein
MAILAGVGWLAGRMGRSLWARWTGNRANHVRHSEIAFYRRLETLLARQGIVRAAGQTQREFAVAAGRQLALMAGQPRLMALPGVVADAFYRVRFGRQPLDNLESQAVEHVLGELTKLERPRLAGELARRRTNRPQTRRASPPAKRFETTPRDVMP